MKKRIFLILLIPVFLSSCVSKRKFVEADTARTKCEKQTTELNKEVKSLIADKVDLNDKARLLERDTTELKAQLSQKEKMLQEERKLLNSSEKELSEKMQALTEREATINSLRKIIDTQNAAMQQLLASVQDALMGFNREELTVTTKNGKVYVAMSDKLLFKSGSATLDARGKEALQSLAEVLKTQKDIDIEVEGHTDNLPIKTAQFKDNWDLSVIRATSVVRILTEEYGLDPVQVTPSGRSSLYPVAENTTPEGRAKNRRTEIILSPKLDSLFEMLNK
ncbi:MAG: OmpA family protein [Bacteroidales bacterium]